MYICKYIYVSDSEETMEADSLDMAIDLFGQHLVKRYRLPNNSTIQMSIIDSYGKEHLFEVVVSIKLEFKYEELHRD